MSGSSGNFSSFSGKSSINNSGSSLLGTTSSGGSGGGNECQLNFHTPLVSPQPEVIKDLQVNDFLRVVLSDDRPNVVECITDKDDIAGTIAPSCIDELIDCLEKGYHYKAKVLSIKHGQVSVHVIPTH